MLLANALLLNSKQLIVNAIITTRVPETRWAILFHVATQNIVFYCAEERVTIHVGLSCFIQLRDDMELLAITDQNNNNKK